MFKKLIAARNAKEMAEMQAGQGAQQSPGGITHVHKGIFGSSTRNATIPPKVARLMAQANMPTATGPAMGGRYGVTDRGENTKDFKKGGKVKKMAKGGSVSSASKRGDGIATKGKTKGKFV